MDDILRQLTDAVRAYKIPAEAIELLDKAHPLILAGASAAGKDTIADYIEKMSDRRRIVTHTTRPPRPGEENGQDYWFVSNKEMLQLLNSQAMIEVKFFPKGSQTIYGISIKAYREVVSAGHKPILTIDVRGIEDIIKYNSVIRPVFILPPSFEEWMTRLDERGAMSHTERIRRLDSARDEMEKVVNNSRFTLVINREIPQASKEILQGATDAPTQHKNRELATQLIEHIKAY